MPEPRDPLDEAFDDALGTYGIAPKSDGLERRILAQVDKRARRARSTKWLVASIAAVVLIGCFLLWTARRETTGALPVNTTARAVRSVEKPPHVPEVLAPAIAVKRPLKRAGITEPKLSRFPASSQMTSQERALIRLVASAAKNPSLRLDPIGGPIEPIRITAIDIKPLQWGR